MPHDATSQVMVDLFIFLIAAVVIVPIFHRLRASPILGYLAIGVAIGPHGFGLIDDVESVAGLAELGVVFLLFTIGLELPLRRLWAMRRLVFGMGSAQVMVSAVVIGGVALAWGNSLEAATVLGLCLALSSTAIVVQLLSERGELATPPGHAAFSVLLFQDLAVVPILFLLPVLGGTAGNFAVDLALALGTAAAAVLVIYVVGRRALRPLFRVIAGTRSAELFVATTLLVTLGIATLTNLAGLSMALGAFLAGLLLAETEFRHQVETDIQPFKGLLLGLFFISVGMGVDFAAVADRLHWVVLSVIGLMLIKGVIAAGMALLFRQPRVVAMQVGFLLSQSGEFAFIVVGAALALGILQGDVAQFMIIVTGVTMMATPIVAGLGRRAVLMMDRHALEIRPNAQIAAPDLEDHIVLAGFGRVGQTIGRLIEAQKVPYIALDLDARRLGACRAHGLPVFYGDASRKDVLERARAGHAACVVVTMDDPARAARTVATMRQSWPGVPVLVRARDRKHATELERAGATGTVPETVEASLQLAAQTMRLLGMPPEAVSPLIETARDDEYAAPTPIIGETTETKSSA
ncbi:MAG: monovalent cation:proton antiporter-2 (CPA2) family protein [Alphaproteobacteria bacterium]